MKIISFLNFAWCHTLSSESTSAICLETRRRLTSLSRNLSPTVRCALFSTTCGPDDATGGRKKAVVVGGGPVGLTAALTLSSPPHSYDVVVLEQTAGDSSMPVYDPTKVYTYAINPSDKQALENFPSALKKLEKRAVWVDAITISGDPKKPLPGKMYTTEEVKVQNAEGRNLIYRHSMVNILEEVIAEREETQKYEKKHIVGSIELIPTKKFLSIQPKDGILEVLVQDSKSPDARYKHTYTASLVVGADGMNSAVREYLANGSQIMATSVPAATSLVMSSWLSLRPKKFRVKKWLSPTIELRVKMLQLPSGFSFLDSDGELVQAKDDSFYSLLSVNTGPLNSMALELFPVKDSNFPWSANIITRPNHDIWKAKDAASIKKWFKHAFPRLALDKLVDDTEWERFTLDQGTPFPYCQYSPGLQVSSPDGKSGVVLIGDARHALPPNIGQGRNAGLSDVLALDRALKGNNIVTGKARGTPANLKTALQEYERIRSPEMKALVRVSRFGAPYRYNQLLRKYHIGQFLWFVNVILREMLNKITSGLIPPVAVVLASKKDLTFRQVMRRADLTTAGLTSVVVTALWLKFGRLM